MAAAGIMAVVTALFATAIPRLAVDTSAEGFMAVGDPARAFYEEFKQEFGTDSLTLVVVKADDVFRPEVLGAVRALSDALEQVEGVTRVESLATARRVVADDDTLENRLLLGPDIPTDAAALADLRTRALGHRVLAKNIVSVDGRATAILVYTDPPATDTDYNRRFVERVDALIATAERTGVTAYQIGRPLLKDTYSRYILRDLRRLIPVSGLVLLVTLLLLFRSIDAVLVPMTTVGVSIVWSFGLMAIFGIPLNVVTAVIPCLLVTIGFTEDVHIVGDYHNHLREGIDRRAALSSAMEATAVPIAVTTITTVIGFASLGFSDVTMLAQFGYGAALSLVGNYFATMALLPAVILALPARRGAVVERRLASHAMARFVEALGWFIARRRVAILVVSGLVMAGATVALSRIVVNTDFVSYFPNDDPLRQRARDVHDVLAGGETFWIVVDTHRPDGVKEPDVLGRIAKLQQHMTDAALVDKTVSVVDYLMMIRGDMHGGRPEDTRLPESTEEVAQYLLMVHARDLASLMNADASKATIVVRHNVTGSAPMHALERALDDYVATAFPAGIDVRYTGEAILTNNAADYMAMNELTSFSFTFAAIAVIHGLLFMSIRIGLLSLVPNLVPIVAVYGLMGMLGVPLDTGTALVATVAIGIAVDDTVHHLMAYSRALAETPNPTLAMFATLRSVGQPIVTASIALAAGFIVVLGSSFVPLQQFGLYAAVTMLMALVTELLLTPALMLTVRVVNVWDLVTLKVDPALLLASPCFQGLSQWDLRKILLLGVLRSYRPGTFVARRGEAGGGMYLILSGRLELDVEGADEHANRAAGALTAGAVIGELTEAASPWTADVKVVEPSDLLLLDADSLERLRRRFPFTAAKLFRNLAMLLTARVRVLQSAGAPP